MFGRRKIAALVAEFLGTGVLTLLIFSVQRSQLALPLFIALIAGLGLTAMTFTFNSTSGALFNPALTVAMWTARKLNTVTAILYIAMQFLGAWAAYGIFKYFAHNTPMQDISGNFDGHILVAEAIGTGIFALGFAATVYQRFTAASGAAVAGLAYVAGIMLASPGAPIGLLNPAVAFGVRAFEWGTYILGPVLGAVIAVFLYDQLFADKAEAAVAEAAPDATTVKPARAVKAAPVRAKRTTAAKKPAAKRKNSSQK